MRWRAQLGLALAMVAIAAPAHAAGGAAFAAFRDVCGSPDMGAALVEVRLAKAGFKRGSPDKPFLLLVGGKLYSRGEGEARVTVSIRHMRKTDGTYWSCGVQVSAPDQKSLEDLGRWIALPDEDGVGFGPGGAETIYTFAQRGDERVPLASDDSKAMQAAFRDRSFRRVYAEIGPSMTSILVVAAVR